MKLIGIHYGSLNFADKGSTSDFAWQALYDTVDLKVNDIVSCAGIYWKIIAIDIQMANVQLLPVGLVKGEEDV